MYLACGEVFNKDKLPVPLLVVGMVWYGYNTCIVNIFSYSYVCILKRL
jgi:hypothetical protein